METKAEQDIHFLYNDLEKQYAHLEDIVHEVQKQPLTQAKRAAFLQRFTKEVLKAYQRRKQEGNLLEYKQKEELLRRRNEILKQLHSFQKEESSMEEEQVVIRSRRTGEPIASVIIDSKYKVKEPELSGQDHHILEELEKKINPFMISNESLLRENIESIMKLFHTKVTDTHYDRIRYYTVRDLLHYAEISVLMEDSRVRQIICPGVGKPLKVMHAGKEMITNIILDKHQVHKVIFALAKMMNKKVSEEDPILHGMIGKKIKVQANLQTDDLRGKFVVEKR